MNRKQRELRHERRLTHQRLTRNNNRSALGEPAQAKAPKSKRRRTLPKRVVRALGRKVRPERGITVPISEEPK